VLYCALPIQAGLIVLGPSFLSVWLHDDPDVARLAGPPLLVLAATLSLTIAQSVAARVLYGTGRIRLFARMAIVEGVANLALSLALVGPLGIVGVAWGTTIPHIGFCAFTIIHAGRQLGVCTTDYLRTWASPAAATAIPTAVWLLSVGPRTYGEFVLTGLAGVAPYAATVLAVERWTWIVGVARGTGLAMNRVVHSAPR
jgi:O-antigen/teichoic acid export membrane protein